MYELPWEGIEPQQLNGFETELVREICKGHLLLGKSHVALARRIDCDDVLLEVDGGPAVAVVHLSYAVEADPQWPATEMFTRLPSSNSNPCEQTLPNMETNDAI